MHTPNVKLGFVARLASPPLSLLPLTRTDFLLALPRHTVSERRVLDSFRHQQGLTNLRVFTPLRRALLILARSVLKSSYLHRSHLQTTKSRWPGPSLVSLRVALRSTLYERLSALTRTLTSLPPAPSTTKKASAALGPCARAHRTDLTCLS